MDSILNNEQLTIVCEGAINSSNAMEFQHEIADRIAAANPQKVIFDLEKVSYISSAGLRAFLIIAKQVPAVEIVNTCAEVYEIFDITGFTSLFPVSRKMRKISIENAELIGSGFFRIWSIWTSTSPVREDPVNDFVKKIQPFSNKKAPGNRFSNQEPWKYSVLLTLRHHRMDSYASHPLTILKSSPGHRYPNS